jgi:hypothetical protein
MAQREYPVASLECAGLGWCDRYETRGGDRQYGQIMVSIGGEQLRWHGAPVRQGGLKGTLANDMGVGHDQPSRMPHCASPHTAPAVVQLYQAQAYVLNDICHSIAQLL